MAHRLLDRQGMATASVQAVVPREPRRLHALIVHYPPIAAALTIAIGTVVLVGWLVDVPEITYSIKGVPVMMPNSAIMAILCGGSLWLMAHARRARAARVVARILAGLVELLALGTLLEYAADIDLGLEFIGSSEHAGLDVPFWPGLRPSPQAALAFGLLALSLFLIDRTDRGRVIADYIAVLIGALAMTALLGYLFGAHALYGQSAVQPYVGVSPITAIVLVALTLGILCMHIERGVMSIVLARDAGGVVARQMLLGLALFPPIAILVIVGSRLGWYALPLAAALTLFLALTEATVFILRTARRLSRFDAVQRQAADELRASESRVRALVDEASDAIFLADLDGHYIDVNPAGCKMLGYTRDELLGMTIADIVLPDEVPRLAEERAIVTAGGTTRGEWHVRRRDGAFIPVEVVANVLTDRRWQAIVRDISERQETARVLALAFEAERQLRADLQAVDAGRAAVAEAVAGLRGSQIDPVLEQIAEQARLLTNAEYAALAIGVDPDRQFDHWVTAGMSDDVARAVTRWPGAAGRGPLRVRDVSEHPGFVGLEHPPIHSFLAMPIQRGGRAVGNLYLANKRGLAEFTERDERLVALTADGVALAIEIANRYAAEAAGRAWLQSVVDQLPEGVLVVDENGHVEVINRVLKSWTVEATAERDPFGNPTYFDLRDPQGAPVPFDDLPLVRALRTGQPQPEQELSMRLSDGRMLPVDARAVPVRDDNGRLEGAVVVTRDISDRKELERLREEWVAVIAHDLRQPIHAITLSLDTLHEHAEERDRPLITRLQTAAYHLNRMIDDLLDAARIAASRLAIECTYVDVARLATESIDRVRMEEPTVDIALDAKPDQLAWIDPDRIHQVLANLLSNAVKYRTPGTTIRVEVAPTPGGIRVGVINEGAPIDPSEMPRLFGRFARTRVSRGKRGVGLGLYISKGLVEAHGGRIWVESDGGLTTFYFTVPAAELAAQQSA